MKLTRIQEELERDGIEPNYTNVAIYVEFAVVEGLVERLRLNEHLDDELAWIKVIFE